MLIVYDFEVFKYDWLVVFADTETHEVIEIVNDVKALTDYYNENKNRIFCGYNSKHYDQWIFKGILRGFDPYKINQFIIEQKNNGAFFDRSLNYVKLLNYDVMWRKDRSLKQLEAFMGHDIRECSIPWNINRKLTEEELLDVGDYCEHDVMETLEILIRTKSEFDSHLQLIKEFDMPLYNINKTKAQLSAEILGAEKVDRHDEWEIDIPDTLDIQKYKHIVDWYREPHDYSDKLNVEVAKCPHDFGWGGLHGALTQYESEGYFVMSDIASMYPAMMIEYNYLSRNVKSPEKYRQIRDDRLILKKAKDPRQLPRKIVLNGTFGASKDAYNPLYDPRMANNICVAGQLFLLDLIEHVEHMCEIVQSNTDGILVKLRSKDDYDEYVNICAEWEKRTRLDLEHDIYKKVIQKDVNNYILVEPNGSYKSKGAWTMKLDDLNNELPIVNKALIEYFINDVPVEDTIMRSDKLMDFQQIVRVSGKFDYAAHGPKKLNERVLRVFASKDRCAPTIYRVRNGKSNSVGNIPDHVFIDNSNVTRKKIPRKLDRQWYVKLALKRIDEFTGRTNQLRFF